MANFPKDDFILKKYQINKSIGQGAFGEVYLATHIGLNGKRAVKVLLHDDIGVGSSDYDEYRNRFRQESQLMELFKDPHLVMVYDFQEEDNTLFLIMEYAAGGSLKQRLDTLKKDGRLFSVEETVKIGVDIARGLAALHQKDVVHRDLKPSNILFDAEGNAKVADLGLAQVPGGASMRSQLSVPKPHPGTPAYMSPEQETAGSYLRPASDIYSLGLILFEMLTGRSYKSLRPGTRLKTLAPESPEWLDDLLMCMLSENPKNRPWDGAETLELLQPKKLPISTLDSIPSVQLRNEKRTPDRTDKSLPDSHIKQTSTTGISPIQNTKEQYKTEDLQKKTNHENSSIFLSNFLLKIWKPLVGVLIVAIIIILSIQGGASPTKDQTLIENPAPTSTTARIIKTPTNEPYNYEESIQGFWNIIQIQSAKPIVLNSELKVGGSVRFAGGFMRYTNVGVQNMNAYTIEGTNLIFTFAEQDVKTWEMSYQYDDKTMLLKRKGGSEQIVLR